MFENDYSLVIAGMKRISLWWIILNINKSSQTNLKKNKKYYNKTSLKYVWKLAVKFISVLSKSVSENCPAKWL